MATFTYSNANSVSDLGYVWDELELADPKTVIVGVDAFVFNYTIGGFDTGLAFLNDSWTVTVHGIVGSFVSSAAAHGIYFGGGVVGYSKFTVGASGVVFGEEAGLMLNQRATVTNAGHIRGNSGQAIFAEVDGTYTIKNSGVLESIAAETIRIEGSGIHTIINSGTMISGAGAALQAIGSGVENLTNSGVIEDALLFGDGNDTLTNFAKVGTKVVNGRIDQHIYMGAGNDVVTGGAFTELVFDEAGRDTYNLGGGDDVLFAAAGAGSGDGFTDSFNGGGGSDTYDATGATAGLAINLDAVMRMELYYLYTIPAQFASDFANGQTGTDRLASVENAIGGSGNDSIFGSAAKNVLDGAGGRDNLYGLAGNDSLFGGSGDDYLIGGSGRDFLDGGANSDTFVYTKLSDSTPGLAGRDVILNYGGGFDTIDFSLLSDGLVFIGVDEKFGQFFPDEIRIVTTASGWLVQLDTSGDRKPDLAIEVVDPGHTINWGSADFML